ncbi:hypothetical protein HQ545_02600 [Candidatus Woesearchaeota archaeon]|nr:hypothetical protein [Candidatus Woesearchaeota archaeon]
MGMLMNAKCGCGYTVGLSIGCGFGPGTRRPALCKKCKLVSAIDVCMRCGGEVQFIETEHVAYPAFSKINF